MIKATTLLPGSWIIHDKLGLMRFTSLVCMLQGKGQFSNSFIWLINGAAENEWNGIPLTPEALLDNGFKLRRDNEWIISYALPNNFFVTWINHQQSPIGPKGSIVTEPGENPIEFVHELQLQYMAATQKELPFKLSL